MASGIGAVFQAFDESRDLIDGASVLARPRAPLLTVNRPKVAIFVGPLVPDANLVFLKVGNVGFTFEKPQQLVNDGAEVELFGREARKTTP